MTRHRTTARDDLSPFDPSSGDQVRDGLLREDPEAIEWVRRWVGGMVRTGGWSLPDPEGAVQEVTLRLLHLCRQGRLREDTDFRSFVRTVARHTCTDIYRRERLRSRVESEDRASEPSAANTIDPEQAAILREQREALRFIFQELSEECRRLWRLVYQEGLAAEDLASRLGISVNNARVRVHRCLKRARAIHARYELGS